MSPDLHIPRRKSVNRDEKPCGFKRHTHITRATDVQRHAGKASYNYDISVNEGKEVTLLFTSKKNEQFEVEGKKSSSYIEKCIRIELKEKKYWAGYEYP